MEHHSPVKTLCVGGGTHGNELHGVYLVKNWLKDNNHQEIKRSSFQTHAVVSNPQATKKCVRYVDVDLNRQFTRENLFPFEDDKQDSIPYEVQRARELYSQFQDKTGGKGLDFWLDLHNATADMGPCFIMSNKNSPFALHIAAQVQAAFPEIRILQLTGIFESVNFDKEQNGKDVKNQNNTDILEFPTGSVSNIAKEGFALEMGPLPHGTFNPAMYNLAKEIVLGVLDAVEEFNRGKEFKEKEIEVFRFTGVVNYPVDGEGDISAMISPDMNGKNWRPLHPGDPLFLSFSGQTIPFLGEHVVWPVFISEAAYFSSKIAFAVTKKEKIFIQALKVKNNN